MRLRPSLNTEVGQPYSSLNVTGDRDLIQSYYLSHGYQNAQVNVVQHNDAKNPQLVDVTMNVEEGQQVFVNKVLVSGLHYTRPAVVTPRVTVRPGEPLDQSALLDSQRRLYNLALFNEVDTAVQNPVGRPAAQECAAADDRGQALGHDLWLRHSRRRRERRIATRRRRRI